MTRCLFVTLLVPLALTQPVAAADAGKREPAALLKSESATMLAREAPDQDWRRTSLAQSLSNLGWFLASLRRRDEARA